MNKKLQKYIYLSILISITIILSLIPQLGFIQIGPISFTIIHAVVIIGIITLDLTSSLILGATFGIGSFIASFIYGATPIDLLFHNPLVSILPRIGFALYGYLMKILIYKINKKNNDLLNYYLYVFIIALFLFLNYYLIAILNISYLFKLVLNICSLVFNSLLFILAYWFKKILSPNLFIATMATIIHTILVLLAISIFVSSDNILFGLLTLIKLVVATNTLFEIIVSLILTVSYTKVLKNYLGGSNDYFI